MSWWLIISQDGLFSIGPIYASAKDAGAIRDAVWYAQGQTGAKPARWEWVADRWVLG